VADAARADGVPMRAYVSCVVECPYEGPVAPAAVARVTESLLALGAYEVSLGDTVGRGTPGTVESMLRAVLRVAPPDRLAGHFHDTNGRALESVETAMAHGLRVFDSAVAGLGGCPYAPGASGNLATERLLDFLVARGAATGVDRTALAAAAAVARRIRETAHGGV
jgi:hydroxymethylglutaryl-CoA lyase